MAGFGFSPNDIIEFGKFAHKIKVALQDDGGAATEYQDAIERCKSFEAALKEVQNLELSHVSAAFADQLKEHADHTKELITGFKKKIAKYEKALGGDGKKGAASGTVRKMQWAVMAAKDLDKFGQSLQLRMQVLEMLMASRTLAIVDQIPSLRAEAGRVGNAIMDMGRMVGRVASQQEVINLYLADIFSEIRYLRSMGSIDVGSKVLELTATMTQLLAGRTDVRLIAGAPRAWTIPDGVDYAVEEDQETLESFINLRPRRDLATAVPSAVTNGNDHEQAGRSTQPQGVLMDDRLALELVKNRDWIEDTNEVLHALELPQIRVEDGLGEKTTQRYHEEHRTAASTNASHSRPQAPRFWSEAQTSSFPQTYKSRKRSKFIRTMGAGMGSSFGGLEAAAGVMGVAALMTQMMSLLSELEDAPTACARIAGRLEDLAPLLEEVADLMATGDELRGGRLIIDRARSLYNDVACTLRTATSSKLGALKWVIERKTVQALLAEMESLKLTLSCTLQAHAVRLQTSNHEQILQSMLRTRQIEHDIRALQRIVQTPNSRGRSPE